MIIDLNYISCNNSRRCPLNNSLYPKSWNQTNLDNFNCINIEVINQVSNYCRLNQTYIRKNFNSPIKLNCNCPALYSDDKRNYCLLRHSLGCKLEILEVLFNEVIE